MASLTMKITRLLVFCCITARQLQGASLPLGDFERLINADHGRHDPPSSNIGPLVSLASFSTPEEHYMGWQDVPDTYYYPSLANSAGPSSQQTFPEAGRHLDHDMSAHFQQGVIGAGPSLAAPPTTSSDHLLYDQSYLGQRFRELAQTDQRQTYYPSGWYAPQLIIPELSEAERYDQLEMLREQIYRLSGVNFLRTAGAEPLIVPYANRLSIAQLSLVISHMTGTKRAPWLWQSGRTRFLLRQGWPNTEPFVLANGFKAGDYNRIFFEAWQEIGEPGSEIFQYLGVFRAPHRSRINPFKAQKLDKALFPIEHFEILSPSTFTTKSITF